MLTVHVARRIITMDPRCPVATAVAVRDDRIVAVGTLEEVTAALRDEPFQVDRSLAEHVILPGLIDQHLHPILGATTLTTEVIATEDWILPSGTFPAANGEHEYRERLRRAEAALDDPDEWLFSWGYHDLWHGDLDRGVLDTISDTRPIGVWQRSCHEFHLNTPAIEALGITEASIAEAGEPAEMISLDRGHFWETGFMAFLMPRLAPVFMTVERLVAGLEQMVRYLHRNGVTAFNEPGALMLPGVWDLYEAILGRDDTPMYSSFIVDARAPADAGVSVQDALEKAKGLIARAPEGKVCFLADQVKLFADGAIISQLMQIRDPYLDAAGNPDPDHHGEWLMKPEVFEERAKAYWDAGYQLHVHVNGDLGLDLVLDTLERRLQENPRPDHRTVVVHFANSTEEQVERIARLGAIVSSNPYYPVGFADKYAQVGLGPARADVMTRNVSVLRHGIALSLHSDLPMGPADPLAMMGFAVNRITPSGRVAGPEQRIDAHAALHAVTLGAAHSWRREHELGSVEVGKIANFTVVDDDPLAVDPMTIGDLRVLGTFFEGRWFPVPDAESTGAAAHRRLAAVDSGAACGSDHRGCACSVAREILAAAAAVLAA